jgi:hypothetical protein
MAASVIGKRITRGREHGSKYEAVYDDFEVFYHSKESLHWLLKH